MHEIARRTGLDLKVAPSVAEDRVTLAIRQTPWETLKGHLATALDAEWVIDSTAGKPIPTLRPTVQRQIRLTKARQARIGRARELAMRLRADLQDKLNWRKRGMDARQPFQPPTIESIVRALPPQAIERAIAHGNPPFMGSEADKLPGAVLPVRRMSAEGRAAVHEHVLDMVELANDREPESKHAEYRRRLPGRTNELVLELWVNRPAPGNRMQSLDLSIVDPKQSGSRSDYEVARAASPVERRPPPGRAVSEPSAREKATVQLGGGMYRYDHALTLLARTGNFDVVADYLTKRKPVRFERGLWQLADVLDYLDRLCGLEHHWAGNTLILKSRDWAEAVDYEPAAAVTDRLEAISAAGGAPKLDDLVFMAARASDDRLATLERHTDEAGKLPPLHLVPRLRMNAPWLRAYATLSSDQRRLAASRTGLRLLLPRGGAGPWSEPLARLGVDSEARGQPVVLRQSNEPPPSIPGWQQLQRVLLLSPQVGEPIDLWRDARSY